MKCLFIPLHLKTKRSLKEHVLWNCEMTKYILKWMKTVRPDDLDPVLN